MHPRNVHDPAAEAPASPALRGRSALDAGQGTQSSNTVPSNSNSESDVQGTRILRVGVDSLYLSYMGEMSVETAIRLKKLKELAQAPEQSRNKLAQFKVHPHLFEVRGNGRHPFAYILDDNWFRVEVSKPDAQSTPLAHVKIASTFLTASGPEIAAIASDEVIKAIGIADPPRVARVDLCVDFISYFPIAEIQEREFVTKTRTIDRYSVEKQFSGFSLGKGGILSARLYNKTLELASKKIARPELEAIWMEAGWQPGQLVYRLEFQLRREALRGLGIALMPQLLDGLAGIWTYCTGTWLKHCIPSDSDRTQSRWPLSSLWAALQRAEWSGDAAISKSRVLVPTGRFPSDERLFVHGLSPLTSFSAREGFVNAGEAAEAYLQAARDFHDGRSGQTGIDFDNYYRIKVEEKCRRFNANCNKPLDGSRHPAEKAVADEYRKRSDGDY